MTKPIASLSLDLDNKWAYLRTHGVAGWEKYPSYFDVVVPRMLRWCDQHSLQMTFFVVGQDALRHENRNALTAIAAAGHEIGNHSLNHEPWLHMLSRVEVEAEIVEAEECIERITGQRPVGFRGPGYSFSAETLEILAERGYWYDASTLPTFIGPLARWYFHRTATKAAGEQANRRALFGSFRDGLRPVRPYLWQTAAGPIVEVPVTTFPLAKLPIHMTYLWHLCQISPRLARSYLRMALAACRWFNVAPSVLLHPLDFLGAEDEPAMRFFPGMNLPREQKFALLDELLSQLTARHQVVLVREHARRVWQQQGLCVPKRHESASLREPLVVAASALD
jgi:peptidoglycan-N-acetylglucosamine deacetylase